MLIVWEYSICYTFIIFIRHRTAENNQRHLSHGFKNILFGDNMHYVGLDLFPLCVFGKSGTTQIWGGAFAPPAPPLATPLDNDDMDDDTHQSNYNPANYVAAWPSDNRLLERLMSPSPIAQVMFASAFS